MNEIVAYIGAAIAGLGGVAGVLVLIARFSASWAQMRIDAKNAESADIKAEAAKDTVLADQLNRVQNRQDEIERELFTIKTERDTYREENKAYKIAINDLGVKIAKLESENGGLKRQLQKLEEMTIELRGEIDKVAGERDNLALELEKSRKYNLELERIAADEREKNALKLARVEAKLEVYESTNNGLRADIREMVSKVVQSAAESSEALPAQEGAESKEATENQ